jgi:hypothetical protein
MLRKHHAPPHVKAVAWAEIARTVTSWTVRPCWREKHAHRDAMLQGATDFLRERWGMRPP